MLIKVAYVESADRMYMVLSAAPSIPPKDPSQKIGLGHEFSGTVVSVGAKVTRFKEGDRVLCEPGIPCGKCEFLS